MKNVHFFDSLLMRRHARKTYFTSWFHDNIWWVINIQIVIFQIQYSVKSFLKHKRIYGTENMMWLWQWTSHQDWQWRWKWRFWSPTSYRSPCHPLCQSCHHTRCPRPHCTSLPHAHGISPAPDAHLLRSHKVLAIKIISSCIYTNRSITNVDASTQMPCIVQLSN